MAYCGQVAVLLHTKFDTSILLRSASMRMWNSLPPCDHIKIWQTPISGPMPILINNHYKFETAHPLLSSNIITTVVKHLARIWLQAQRVSITGSLGWFWKGSTIWQKWTWEFPIPNLCRWYQAFWGIPPQCSSMSAADTDLWTFKR